MPHCTLNNVVAANHFKTIDNVKNFFFFLILFLDNIYFVEITKKNVK